MSINFDKLLMYCDANYHLDVFTIEEWLAVFAIRQSKVSDLTDDVLKELDNVLPIVIQMIDKIDCESTSLAALRTYCEERYTFWQNKVIYDRPLGLLIWDFFQSKRNFKIKKPSSLSERIIDILENNKAYDLQLLSLEDALLFFRYLHVNCYNHNKNGLLTHVPYHYFSSYVHDKEMLLTMDQDAFIGNFYMSKYVLSSSRYFITSADVVNKNHQKRIATSHECILENDSVLLDLYKVNLDATVRKYLEQHKEINSDVVIKLWTLACSKNDAVLKKMLILRIKDIIKHDITFKSHFAFFDKIEKNQKLEEDDIVDVKWVAQSIKKMSSMSKTLKMLSIKLNDIEVIAHYNASTSFTQEFDLNI